MNLGWTDNLGLGEARVDAQHRAILDVAASLFASGEDVARQRSLLMQLYKLSREHFALEEQLMRDSRYAARGEHTAYHDQLLDAMHSLSSEVGQGHLDLAHVKTLLIDWRNRHIASADAALMQHLRQQA